MDQNIERRNIIKAKISIDLRKPRIRIYKETLHALNDPESIMLLVNPETKTLIIRACEGKDKRSHSISWNELDAKTSYELYSTSLIRQLKTLTPTWKDDESYRGVGVVDPKRNMALFRLGSMTNISAGINYE